MNQLTEFLFPDRGVRGALVEIDQGIDALLGWRDYGADVLHLLGEALAATPLLASHLKLDGRINLQFQNGQALKLLVTQIDGELQLRGMAQADAGAAGDFQALMQGGLLALLLEPGRGTSYQGVVEIRGATLAEALEGYFAQSEQLDTLMRLAARPDRFCGLMLQRLPARTQAADDENWSHLRILGGTVTGAELLAVEGATLLRRLFMDEHIRVTPPRPVQLACRCSHAGISAMLLSLGEAEIAPLLAEQGKVEVTCEFCGRVYTYTPAEAHALFAAARTHPEHPTRQ